MEEYKEVYKINVDNSDPAAKQREKSSIILLIIHGFLIKIRGGKSPVFVLAGDENFSPI